MCKSVSMAGWCCLGGSHVGYRLVTGIKECEVVLVGNDIESCDSHVFKKFDVA